MGCLNVTKPRSVAVYGRAFLKQIHCTSKTGGVHSEQAANIWYDAYMEERITGGQCEAICHVL